ncbi:glycosyltransferase [Pseudanabaenaceae cyanobacterium LEGE 13415]|nr:glycosyltransferase [Pseudanabaenaceae cyanobacterium LEGE 13415]
MSQPIPFLFYAPYSKSFTGGPRVFLNLIERLDKTQFRPICVSHCESLLTNALRDRQIETIILPFPKILEVYNEGVFAYSWIDKLRSLKALVQYNSRLEQIARRYQVRGIWGRNVKSILLIGLAARRLGVPLIWDVGMEKPSRGLMRHLHWIGLSLASVVVTEASSQPQTIFDPKAVRQFEKKFIAIAPGTNVDRITTSIIDRHREPTAPFKILNVGTIQPRKNQLLLLRAIQPLVQQYPQIQVQFAGSIADELYFSECKAFIEAHNLSESVSFLGWRDDILELMQQSNLFVLCSHNEGVPCAIGEAMYAGLPMIATAIGGIPEIISHKETGFLIEPDAVTQLQDWIEFCLLNPSILEEIGTRSREVAQQKFSIVGWSSRYNELLRQLCQI